LVGSASRAPHRQVKQGETPLPECERCGMLSIRAENRSYGCTRMGAICPGFSIAAQGSGTIVRPFGSPPDENPTICHAGSSPLERIGLCAKEK